MKQIIKCSLCSAVCLLLLAPAKTAIGQATNHPVGNPSGYNDRTSTFTHDATLNQAIILLGQQLQNEPTNSALIYNLAVAYGIEGNNAQSLVLWTEFIHLNPTNDVAYKARANTYDALGKHDEAIKDYNEGLRLNPNDALALANRGFVYTEKGNYDLAAQDYLQAIGLAPNNAAVCNDLAWLRATCPVASMRDGKEAEVLALRACDRSHWARWTFVDTLAAACAEAGDFQKAIMYDQMALKMVGVAKNDAQEMQNHLALFHKQQPCHEAEVIKQ